MSALFSPFKIKNLTLPNRIVIGPMCQYSSDDGAATDWHMIHLGHLALSGAGMLIIEATSVEPGGRIAPGDLGLWDDRTETALKPVIDAIRKYSSIAVCVQLAHAGRKASSNAPWDGGQQLTPEKGGWIPDAPSPIPTKDGEIPPHELDKAGMERIKKAFVDSAKRAARLGIDAVEVHGAHGYLLHEFLSPLSNKRTDEYGGSLANRMRYPLEVYDAVRAAFPADKPVGIRLSATDWIEGGWDLEQTVVLTEELKKRGVDWVDASSGGISMQQKIPLGPGYQVPFAERLKKDVGVNTFAVGLITDAKQAEDIVASGKADFVALARGILYDPRWPWHAAAELGATVDGPRQYWRSPPAEHKNLFGETRIARIGTR